MRLKKSKGKMYVLKSAASTGPRGMLAASQRCDSIVERSGAVLSMVPCSPPGITENDSWVSFFFFIIYKVFYIRDVVVPNRVISQELWPHDMLYREKGIIRANGSTRVSVQRVAA
jgi:hypothetical protein